MKDPVLRVGPAGAHPVTAWKSLSGFLFPDLRALPRARSRTSLAGSAQAVDPSAPFQPWNPLLFASSGRRGFASRRRSPVLRSRSRSSKNSGGKILLVVLGILLSVAAIAFRAARRKARRVDLQPGYVLDANLRSRLHRLDIVRADEEIVYFYSGSLLDSLDEGSVITDQRVISFEKRGGSHRVSSLEYGQIQRIEHSLGGGLANNTRIEVRGPPSSETVTLHVTSRRGADRRFIEEVRRRVGAALRGEEVFTRGQKIRLERHGGSR